MTNCEAYSSFSSLYSDHRVVTAKVQLRLRKTKPNPAGKIPKYMWSDLSSNKVLQESYAIEVRNRYQLLLDESDGDGPHTQDYDKFVLASAEAAKEFLRPTPKKKKKVKSLDPRVTAIREEVEEAYKLFLSAGKESTMRDHYKEKKEQLYYMYATCEHSHTLGRRC